MKTEKWILRGGRGKDIAERYHLPPFLGKIIAVRLQGETVEAFLDKEASLFDPSQLLDMDRAAMLITEVASRQGRIGIVGDYDVDGMTSSSILYLGLTYLFPGISVSVRIPDRVRDGYGFRLEIAKELVQAGVDLVLTCDNGIREFESALFLQEAGIPLIITDHHEIEQTEAGEDKLPEAAAVVNPHRQGDASPMAEICGAFVAYQVIRKLAMDRQMDPEADPLLLQLKGYAAIGTVCDVMPLTGENRRLVHQGLMYLEKHPTIGIKELMKQGSVERLDPYTVGFGIGPMINAGGRLSSQETYLTILIGSDTEIIRPLAAELYRLNKERQRLTEEGIEQGLSQVGEHTTDTVQVIYLPELHESIAGLVAGKVKEKTYRPTFVITRTLDPEGKAHLKGSGRSIESYHMFQHMNEHAKLFERFGGHAMAAGFSLQLPQDSSDPEEEAVETMRQLLNQDAHLSAEDLMPIVYIDAAVDPTRLKVDAIHQIDLLGPFGNGNPKPTFAAKHLRLTKVMIFGKRRNVLRLILINGVAECEMVYFQVEEFLGFLEEGYGRKVREEAEAGRMFTAPILLDVVFQSEIDTYYGVPSVKNYLRHFRPSLDDK